MRDINRFWRETFPREFRRACHISRQGKRRYSKRRLVLLLASAPLQRFAPVTRIRSLRSIVPLREYPEPGDYRRIAKSDCENAKVYFERLRGRGLLMKTSNRARVERLAFSVLRVSRQHADPNKTRLFIIRSFAPRNFISQSRIVPLLRFLLGNLRMQIRMRMSVEPHESLPEVSSFINSEEARRRQRRMHFSTVDRIADGQPLNVLRHFELDTGKTFRIGREILRVTGSFGADRIAACGPNSNQRPRKLMIP